MNSFYEIANLDPSSTVVQSKYLDLFEENKKIEELNEFNLMDANRIIDISMLNKFTQGNQKKICHPFQIFLDLNF